jgi:CDGSH-type Zn-finger protein
VTRGGPLHLHGDIEVLDDQGNVILRDTRVALCRCGLSKHKPLCDDSHAAAGFAEEGVLREPDRVEDPGATGTGLRVTLRTHGPLEITGPFAIASADRKTLLAGTKTKLCRCGHSGAKPFCDGSHKRLETPLE